MYPRRKLYHLIQPGPQSQSGSQTVGYFSPCHNTNKTVN